MRKRNDLTAKPDPDAISGRSQMLAVNCSAAGGSFSGNIHCGVIVHVSP